MFGCLKNILTQSVSVISYTLQVSIPSLVHAQTRKQLGANPLSHKPQLQESGSPFFFILPYPWQPDIARKLEVILNKNGMVTPSKAVHLKYLNSLFKIEII